MTEHQLFMGTYTKPEDHVDGKAEGIYRCSFDNENGSLRIVDTIDGIVNPSFCIVSRNNKFLYAVSEIDNYAFGKGANGAIFSYSINKTSVRQISSVSSIGTSPCHLTEDPTGSFLYAANYISGSIVMVPVDTGGRISKACDFVQHTGKGPNPLRQEGPHAHSVHVDPTGDYLLALDLGMDKIMVYRIDREAGKLRATDFDIDMTPGSGPRHFCYHPSFPAAYAINELASTITVFQVSTEENPGLVRIQEISTLPVDCNIESTCAEAAVHPNGKYLYASNRGHDSITCFEIEAGSGKLRFLGTEPTRGRTPRHFTIAPGGSHLLAANQDSDTVAIYQIEEATGSLNFQSIFDVPSPVCLQWY